MPDPYDPNRPNPMPVPGQDWSSMAGAILPGILGALLGGGRGALMGAAGGASGIVDQGEEALKYNNALQFKKQEAENQQRQLEMEKQRVGLDERRVTQGDRRLTAEEKNWEVANKLSESHMALYKAHAEESALKLSALKENKDAVGILAKEIKDPVERARFTRDPEKYEEQRLEASRKKALGEVAGAVGVPKKVLEAMDSKQGADFIADLYKSRNEGKPFHFFSESSGTLFYGDSRNPGAIQSKKIQEPKATVGKDVEIKAAGDVMREARQQVSAALPKDQLGNIILGPEWGKTLEDRTAKFEGQVDRRSKEIAEKMGMPNLFAQPIRKPEDALQKAMSDGLVTKESEAVAFLINRGMKPDKAAEHAKSLTVKLK